MRGSAVTQEQRRHHLSLRAPGGHQRPGPQQRPQQRLDNVISTFWSSRHEWWVYSAEDRGRLRSHEKVDTPGSRKTQKLPTITQWEHWRPEQGPPRLALQFVPTPARIHTRNMCVIGKKRLLAWSLAGVGAICMARRDQGGSGIPEALGRISGQIDRGDKNREGSGGHKGGEESPA